MSKLPFMQFYPGDWTQDTQILTLEAQGAWMKLLCAMWIAPERGSITFKKRDLNVFLANASDDVTHQITVDLGNVANVDWRDSDGNSCENWEYVSQITFQSRRMIRDEAKRKQGLEADRRYRENKTSNKRPKHVAKTSKIYQKSEVRSHTSEEDKIRPAQLPKAAWPMDDIWLLDLIKKQPFLKNANGYLEDYGWWEGVAKFVGDIEPDFVTPEFAKMGVWLRENPQREPTAKGMRRFIRTWLEKAKEKRRFNVSKK